MESNRWKADGAILKASWSRMTFWGHDICTNTLKARLVKSHLALLFPHLLTLCSSLVKLLIGCVLPGSLCFRCLECLLFLFCFFWPTPLCPSCDMILKRFKELSTDRAVIQPQVLLLYHRQLPIIENKHKYEWSFCGMPGTALQAGNTKMSEIHIPVLKELIFFFFSQGEKPQHYGMKLL